MLSFLFCPIIYLYVLSSVLLSCPLRFPHKNDVFTSRCLWEDTCLIYIICVSLRVLVSSTYCVVFLLSFSSSCVPYVASFSRFILFLIVLSVFSNVSLLLIPSYWSRFFFSRSDVEKIIFVISLNLCFIIMCYVYHRESSTRIYGIFHVSVTY